MESEPLGAELSDQDRVLLLFGYLGPLAFVSLIASRKEFVKWHAKQGLVLWVALLVVYLGVLRPAIAIAGGHQWSVLTEIFWAATWLVALGVVVMTLVCVVRGLEGERFKLPLLGDLADRM